ncbi:SCAN domain-containing protein 3 [Zootermopsis nevadensis]|uniref:SCAN domain-containing protein 3 n=1 Tax=Zootermopsis nevadensis TaxID=136037 RepID=A0A067QS76_ZOONE|nr:SCAN domain-containing protein 3 [Zootermopsis nevadensis]
MDKFNIKRKREIDDSVESQKLKSAIVSVPTCDVSVSSVEPSTSKRKRQKRNVKADKVKCRYYNEYCIKYGFVSNLCDPPLPLSVMKPSLLHWHLVTNHGEFKDKPAEFFERKAENVRKTSNVIHNFTQSSKVALETSYELALLAAKNKSSYTAVVSLILPGALCNRPSADCFFSLWLPRDQAR